MTMRVCKRTFPNNHICVVFICRISRLGASMWNHMLHNIAKWIFILLSSFVANYVFLKNIRFHITLWSSFSLVCQDVCVCVCLSVWWCSRTFASLSWTLNIIKHFELLSFYIFVLFIFSFSFGFLWLFLQGLEQLSLYPSGNRLCVVTFAMQTRSNRHLDISQCFLYFLVAWRLKWMNVYKFLLKFLKLRWWRFDPGSLCVSAVVPWK